MGDNRRTLISPYWKAISQVRGKMKIYQSNTSFVLLRTAVLLVNSGLWSTDSVFPALPKKLAYRQRYTEPKLKRKIILRPHRLAVPSQLACELFARAFPGDQVLNPFIVGVIFRSWVIGKVHQYVSQANNDKGNN